MKLYYSNLIKEHCSVSSYVLCEAEVVEGLHLATMLRQLLGS